MKKSLLLVLLLSTGVWAVEKPMPDSCQKFVQFVQEVAEVLDKNNPEEKKFLDGLESLSSELQQEWDKLQAANASNKVNAAELQEVSDQFEDGCTGILQEIGNALEEAIESKTTE